MSTLTSVSGFPRIGQNRELKKIIEGYWKGANDLTAVKATAAELRAKHWKLQQAAGIDLIPSNDFSYYLTPSHAPGSHQSSDPRHLLYSRLLSSLRFAPRTSSAASPQTALAPIISTLPASPNPRIPIVLSSSPQPQTR